MRTLRNFVIAVAFFALIVFGVNAFAHSGMGWGGGGHHGQGWHHRGGYDAGGDESFDKEDYTQFEEKREAFLKETREVRAGLIEKQQALQGELAKSEPDAAKASGLQKEISELQSQFDQKRIDHMVEMRKLNPKAGRGFMRGGPMMGKGGPMMGKGPRGGGYCWE